MVATGGLPFAKLGATDVGYSLARQFGLGVTETRPGLVPLAWSASDKTTFEALSGVSLPVRASCQQVYFEEALLFTHRGLSGPAVLREHGALVIRRKNRLPNGRLPNVIK